MRPGIWTSGSFTISCCSKWSGRPAAIRAGVKTKFRNFPGPRIMFRCRQKVNRWRASCSKTWACSAMAHGTSVCSASTRKSACSSTAIGKRALSPRTARHPRIAQFRRFQQKIDEFRATGQFTVPMERGAKPSPLDRISMADWLAQQGFDAAPLRWYVDYACRDDYGALAKDTSAWAGVQYFASREPEEKGPLTWPEGNGWIATRLIEKLKRYLRTGDAVYRVARSGNKIRILTEQTEYIADTVIWAAPTFLASYIVEGAPRAEGFQYSPWLTANLTLDRIPDQKNGEPAWDNVVYDSPTLGYVNATH